MTDATGNSALAEARAHIERGDPAAARTAFRTAAGDDPNDPDPLIELGVLEAQSGDMAAARDAFLAAHRIAPEDPVILLNLAELDRESGALDEAIAHYEACLTQLPNDADALYGLGDTLRLRGNFGAALDALERARAAAPHDPEILNALGVVCDTLGRTKRSLAAYGKAIEIDPAYPEPRLNLALALSTSGRHHEAFAAYEAADRVGGLDGAALLAWARAAIHLDRDADALALTTRAAAQGAGEAETALCRGAIHEHFGRFDDAVAEYRRAIDYDPQTGHAYKHLARMRQLSTEAAPRLADILDDDTADPASRSSAGFALFHLNESAGEFERAFAALDRANQLMRTLAPFDRDRHTGSISDTIAFFTAARMKKTADMVSANAAPAPIFIIGMPRTGTTLTEQILAYYDTVHAGGERTDIQNLALSLPHYPHDLAERPAAWFEAQSKKLIESMAGGRGDVRFVTDKAPGNYIYCGLIAMLFPNARIVHCRRDPMDTALSLYAQDFRSGINYSYALEEIAHVYREYSRVMDHWRQVLPIEIHDVAYETLVQETDACARSLVEYSGLEWDDACIATHEVDRPIHTASVWQVRQPISASSVGKWKRYERQLEPLARWLGLN